MNIFIKISTRIIQEICFKENPLQSRWLLKRVSLISLSFSIIQVENLLYFLFIFDIIFVHLVLFVFK